MVKPSSLGDIIHALPVLQLLRKRFPAARIDWLVASGFASMIQGHPALDGLVRFDRRALGAVWRPARACTSFLRLVRDLRERRYDLVIDLQGLFRSGLLSRASGAPVRLGFREGREGAPLFYTHHIPASNRETHAVDRNLLAARMLGCDEADVCFDLALLDSERARAMELVRKSAPEAVKAVQSNEQPACPGSAPGGLVPSESADAPRLPAALQRPLVGIVPGARWETKQWAEERFAQVSRSLLDRGARVVLIGGLEDTARCGRIARLCALPVIDLSGKTTLRELAAVIGLCDVVLCHDSAPLHLAVALQRPLVCLTGPTNPARTGPYRRMADVVRLELDCSPCYLRRLGQCPHGHRCMRDLTAERVVHEIFKRLE